VSRWSATRVALAALCGLLGACTGGADREVAPAVGSAAGTPAPSWAGALQVDWRWEGPGGGPENSGTLTACSVSGRGWEVVAPGIEGASSYRAADIAWEATAAHPSCSALLPAPAVTFGCFGRMREVAAASVLVFRDSAPPNTIYYRLSWGATTRSCIVGSTFVPQASSPESSVDRVVHTVCRFGSGTLARFTDGAPDGAGEARLPAAPLTSGKVVLYSVPDGDREYDDCFIHAGPALSDRDICRIWACDVGGSRCSCDASGGWLSRGRWDEAPGRCALPPRCDQPAPEFERADAAPAAAG
jgi:hypothetical protein